MALQMWVVMRLQDAEIMIDEETTIGVLPVYATKEEAEAAFPGEPIVEVREVARIPTGKVTS